MQKSLAAAFAVHAALTTVISLSIHLHLFFLGLCVCVLRLFEVTSASPATALGGRGPARDAACAAAAPHFGARSVWRNPRAAPNRLRGRVRPPFRLGAALARDRRQVQRSGH